MIINIFGCPSGLSQIILNKYLYKIKILIIFTKIITCTLLSKMLLFKIFSYFYAYLILQLHMCQ